MHSVEELRESDISHIIKSVQRVDLNPLEVARSLAKLIEKFGLTQRELARRIGKKRSTIANYLRLLALPSSIQHSLQTGLISMGHAKAILAVEGEKQQEATHKMILQQKLTVRQAEECARLKTQCDTSHQTIKDEHLHIRDLETRIQQRMGGKVELRGKGAKGQLVLHYYDLDDLDRILLQLGVST